MISQISLINGAKFGNNNTIDCSSFSKVGNMCVFNLQLDTTQLTDFVVAQLPEELYPKGGRVQRPFTAVDSDGNAYIVWLLYNGTMGFAGEIAYPKKHYVVISGVYPC